MKSFDSIIREQLEAYQQALYLAKVAGRADNVSLVRAQIDAYRLGLATCLSDKYVARIFKDFELT